MADIDTRINALEAELAALRLKSPNWVFHNILAEILFEAANEAGENEDVIYDWYYDEYITKGKEGLLAHLEKVRKHYEDDDNEDAECAYGYAISVIRNKLASLETR